MVPEEVQHTGEYGLVMSPLALNEMGDVLAKLAAFSYAHVEGVVPRF